MSSPAPASAQLSRRTLLASGAAAGLFALAQIALPSQAHAAGSRPGAGPVITSLGPGIVQYSLMSGVLVGDVYYVGSRNLEPAGVVGIDLTTGKVAHQTTLATGYAIQALAVDPQRNALYIGVLQKSGGPQANLYRWDLSAPQLPASPIGTIGDRDVRDLAVAPDGMLFAVGGGSGTAPALWQWSPATGAVTDLGTPDATATLARAVAATDSHAYFGAGSTLGGGGSTSRASLYAYDRAQGGFTDITPTGMLPDPSIRELAVLHGELVVSTAGAAEPSKLATLSLTDHSVRAIITSIGKTAKNFTVVGDTIHCANEAGILAWNPQTADLRQLDLGLLDLGEIWGLDARGGNLVAASGYGFLGEVTTAGATVQTIDLSAAGAPVSAQTCMGVAAGGGFAYVGGNGGIARHDLATGEVVNLLLPGEAKDAEVIGGVLYTGQYSGQGIWRYDPRSGAPITRVASFPSTQNRPLDTEWDAAHGLLLVAAQADTEGGGSIWTFDPETGASTCTVNPIDDIQLVRAVAAADGIAYLGGDNAQKTGPRGTIVAWDPVNRTELWRLETGTPNGIASLETHGRHLFALTLRGTLIVVDRPTRRIVHTADLRSICPGFSAMKAARGAVYAVSDTTLFRIDRRAFATTVVVPEINGGWYSGPHLNIDEDEAIYTLRGRDLVKVIDNPQA
ncbi:MULTISPECIES: PQQ-binding-like beta-propeller repeat protein [unclassified Microbacterium]|uniref:outer membrane protein assembly factor BamB family protein n=1 Tax=unclassified Microbacterium TaxID=2609290 RepID=UPI0012F7509E|nr:PQQ-binding-like beta-propeller repeat protein [Microbacterium sp. MAH-37]MVQ42067.1 PQQ-binding-like beta-propeller repeat protein [Microbacterium sp. MAH-37]